MKRAMENSLRLSVVMATFNRAETLRQTIDCLCSQDLNPALYEVIIIDDGSTDNTFNIVSDYFDKTPFQLTYLHHSNRGPGYTQNRGILEARAPLILLMADDILMTTGALSAHIKIHDKFPEITTAVLGQVQQSPKLTQNLFLKKWEPFRFRDFSGLSELPYYRFWACNISAKKEFLLRNGAFCEQRGRAGAASHEDPELGYRLSLDGLRILYEPAALGYHYHVVNLEGACERRRMQGLNFGEFLAKVPEPEIVVAYHLLTSRTFLDHLRAWFGPRRMYLQSWDRNPAVYLFRDLTRRLLFNNLTVNAIWLPMLKLSEHNQFLARLAIRQIYRGVTFHFFLLGCREAEKTYENP